jgi:hypothetical protein
MPHDDLVYVGHMFDAATKAVEKVAESGGANSTVTKHCDWP